MIFDKRSSTNDVKYWAPGCKTHPGCGGECATCNEDFKPALGPDLEQCFFCGEPAEFKFPETNSALCASCTKKYPEFFA